jgi:hypothetical protein
LAGGREAFLLSPSVCRALVDLHTSYTKVSQDGEEGGRREEGSRNEEEAGREERKYGNTELEDREGGRRDKPWKTASPVRTTEVLSGATA